MRARLCAALSAGASRKVPIDARGTGAICDQQQEATRNRYVLHEHDHLCLIGKVVVERERGD